jgi:phage tail sheath gpL-like
MASNAIIQGWISRIVGYAIGFANFQTVSPNLPQSIAVLGEMNEANQAADLTPTKFSNAQSVGAKYGYGSPLHILARILFPVSGGGVSGLPVTFYPQVKATGAVAKVITIAPTGTATKNGTHTVKVAGRGGLDGVFYDVSIVIGDTPTIISQKISDAVNKILGTPVIAALVSATAVLTSKWAGKTSDDIIVTIENNNDTLGVTYVVTNTTAGSGTPSISAALSFGNTWHTVVLNSYGADTSIMAALEAYNGIPSNTIPTGRFTGIVMKPFIAITGSTIADPSSLTDSRNLDVTIAIAPAPLSNGLPMEAAANATVLFALNSQNSPELDIAGQSYPDMPTPSTIGVMSDATNRNNIVKKGCSTVDLNNGLYVVQDFVTTYHPVGEEPAQFRYARNLMLDFNIRFSYYLKEQKFVIGAVIANDGDIVTSNKVIKPKTWKAEVSTLADELVSRGLIVDASFMKAGTIVNISTTNPDRFETQFPYKRSGVARVVSTTATAGFNFGQIN